VTIKQHIRMTASEIAMGRYMRAPDHDAGVAEFDAAFSAEALKDVVEDKPAAATSETPPAETPAAETPAAETPAAETPAAEAPVVETPAAETPAAETPAAETPAAETPVVETPPAAEAPSADAEAILEQLAKAVAKQPKVETPPVETPAAEAPPLFTEDETATLAKFREDWPKEAEAVDLMQRELGRGVIQYVFDQIAPEVKQLRDLVQTLALRAHQSDLDATIGEYPSDEEIDSIKKWVTTQPTYLQGAMNDVIEKGIGDLVGRYREVTGKKPAGAQDDPNPPVDTELSGAAKQAAEALAPVGSKRTAVQSPEDATDFDAAWAKFADQQV
jgi:hypothetical protein